MQISAKLSATWAKRSVFQGVRGSRAHTVCFFFKGVIDPETPKRCKVSEALGVLPKA